MPNYNSKNLITEKKESDHQKQPRVIIHESYYQKQPRVIIAEGLLYPAKEGEKIKTCIARLGILLGFKIEQINCQWILLDKINEPRELKKIKAIISEGLVISSKEGREIKTRLAQIGNLLGFKIERKGSNRKWKFTDASSWLKAREAYKSSD
ncbi:MAG: hypothetical protein AAF383_09990 [Cyanobacteria bacterium P01_A01_bin.83]